MYYITTFAPEPYHLKRDIPVVVEMVENGYVASFVDANINASGETKNDAVRNLKDLMVTLYEHLEKLPEKKLGKSPERNWQFCVGLFAGKNVMAKITKQHANEEVTR